MAAGLLKYLSSETMKVVVCPQRPHALSLLFPAAFLEWVKLQHLNKENVLESVP